MSERDGGGLSASTSASDEYTDTMALSEALHRRWNGTLRSNSHLSLARSTRCLHRPVLLHITHIRRQISKAAANPAGATHNDSSTTLLSARVSDLAAHSFAKRARSARTASKSRFGTTQDRG
jgi:hypothetical protein